MVAALRCVRPQFQWYQLAYATEMKSIQLHDSIEGLSQKIVSITLHYIMHFVLQPTAWDRQAVREDLPGPSQRYQQQYKLIEDDRKKAYQSKTLPISSVGFSDFGL